MTRTALLTLVLSATAIVAYLGYRVLLPQPSAPAVSAPAASAPAASAPAASETAGVLESLPDFSLADLSGGMQSIRSWPNKALVINFWATWCAPCLREIPLLKEFQEQHAEHPVQVIGIAVDRLEPVQEFAREIEFNYPILVGETEGINAAASFGVDFFALPFTVFTDTEGAILGVHTGEIHPEDLENLSTTLTELGSGAIDRAIARTRLDGFR